jgi:hypothetical protein
LGEGTMVGKVTTYGIQGPNGDLFIGFDAEESPDPADVPDGGTIIVMPDTPKIQLDECDAPVYGFDVFWKPVRRIPDFSAN